MDYEQFQRDHAAKFASDLAAQKAKTLQKKREEREKKAAAATRNAALQSEQLAGRESAIVVQRQELAGMKFETEDSEVVDRNLPRYATAVKEENLATMVPLEVIARLKFEAEEDEVVDRGLAQSTRISSQTNASAPNSGIAEGLAPAGSHLQKPCANLSVTGQNLEAAAMSNDLFDYAQITEVAEETLSEDADGDEDEDFYEQDQEREDSQEHKIGNAILQIAEGELKAQAVKESETRSYLLPKKWSLAPAGKRKSTDEKSAQPQLKKRRTINVNGPSQLEDLIVEEPRIRKSKSSKVGKVVVVSVQYIQPKAGVVSTSMVFDLVNLTQLIHRYIEDYRSRNTNILSQLRSQVQQANLAILPERSPTTTSSFENIVERILSDPASQSFPWDVCRDMATVVNRLKNGPLDGSLLRGIYIKRSTLQDGAKRNWKVIDQNYEHRKECNVAGANGLVNGQWWLERVDALRDGAHGSREAGIHGLMGHGAFSIVIASGGYADKDNGEVVEYCGTASKTSTPTTSTKYMEESYRKRHPLRVLRGVSTSEYAPSEGIRYDGLYSITEREVLDADTAMYRYTLRRVQGQDPIRYQGVEKRPNPFEIAERKRIQAWVDTIP